MSGRDTAFSIFSLPLPSSTPYHPPMAPVTTDALTALGIHPQNIAKKEHLLRNLEKSGIGALPELIHRSFMLPRVAAELDSLAENLDVPEWQEALKLKRSALDIACNKEALKTLSGIADPLAKEGTVVQLMLVEILYCLTEKLFSIEEIEQCNQYWTEIADHFGLWMLRYEIEDTMFQILEPENYTLFLSLLTKQKKIHEELFKDVRIIIKHALAKEGLKNMSILSRQKNVFGVYQKMQFKQKNINHVSDLFGVRIIVPTEKDCYTVLEVLHKLWPPYTSKFKDFVASPKPNGYQSIHTTLHCLHKESVEFQIRSEQMDTVAKFGPAAHALYKKEVAASAA